MKIQWIGYWTQTDGYGRFNTRLVQALQRANVDVRALHIADLERPRWLLDQMAIDWSRLTISCVPPYMAKPVPGRQWLYSMTEGSILPDSGPNGLPWAETVNAAGVERVLVPCAHNAEAFRRSGIEAPVTVVPGGTDPEEFPLRTEARPERPYTFLTLADRNERKGWHEVWEAFYKAFGGKTTGDPDVRLIIKCLSTDNVTQVMANAQGADPRIIYQNENAEDMAAVYAQADCVVLPSRSEGWGMPHREAAMMGIPVITQAYSGMDDGHTHKWALVVERGRMAPIPKERHMNHLGEWRIADVEKLAEKMRWCYENPERAILLGFNAARWLRWQTWDHTALQLLDLIRNSETEHAVLAA